MKRYKLLKDLPFAKAGEVFQEWLGARNQKGERALFSKNHTDTTLWPNDIENFDEWFEEVKEPELPKEFFYVLINKIASVNYLTFSFDEETRQEYRNIVEKHKSVDNYFETKEEAEKYLAYLKAKAIIKKDTKGFKPNWEDFEQDKFYTSWDFYHDRPVYGQTRKVKEPTIYFKTIKDLEESLKNHPEEWKTYHTYNQ